MRTPTSFRHIADMTAYELKNRLDHAERFTAYDITRALRAANPGLDIPHTAVRHIVHQCMAAVERTGFYQACPTEIDGRDAVLYAPTPEIRLPYVPPTFLN